MSIIIAFNFPLSQVYKALFPRAHLPPPDYSPWRAYANSKLALVMMATALERHLTKLHLLAHCSCVEVPTCWSALTRTMPWSGPMDLQESGKVKGKPFLGVS